MLKNRYPTLHKDGNYGNLILLPSISKTKIKKNYLYKSNVGSCCFILHYMPMIDRGISSPTPADRIFLCILLRYFTTTSKSAAVALSTNRGNCWITAFRVDESWGCKIGKCTAIRMQPDYHLI